MSVFGNGYLSTDGERISACQELFYSVLYLAVRGKGEIARI